MIYWRSVHDLFFKLFWTAEFYNTISIALINNKDNLKTVRQKSEIYYNKGGRNEYYISKWNSLVNCTVNIFEINFKLD